MKQAKVKQKYLNLLKWWQNIQAPSNMVVKQFTSMNLSKARIIYNSEN